MPIIEVNQLNKTFKQAIKEPGLKGSIKHLFTQQYKLKTAVDNINLSINEGETVAYVGPNGAGKSTTIKMLSGILVPTSGELKVNGLVPYQQRMKHAKQVGVVFGQRTQLWWDLPIRESYQLLKDIYEIPEQQYKKNLDTFHDLLSLGEFIDLPARKLSLGQRMRADLAASLLHNPPLIFLDEPTIGLDISVKAKIRTFIKEMNKQQQSTILLTTHDMEDIKDICERLVIIDKGKIIYDGKMSKVADRFAKERTMHFQLNSVIEQSDPSLFAPLSYTQTGERTLSITFNRFENSAGEVAAKVMNEFEVIDFKIDEPSIDQIIQRMYEGKLDAELEQSKEAD